MCVSALNHGCQMIFNPSLKDTHLVDWLDNASGHKLRNNLGMYTEIYSDIQAHHFASHPTRAPIEAGAQATAEPVLTAYTKRINAEAYEWRALEYVV